MPMPNVKITETVAKLAAVNISSKTGQKWNAVPDGDTFVIRSEAKEVPNDKVDSFKSTLNMQGIEFPPLIDSTRRAPGGKLWDSVIMSAVISHPAEIIAISKNEFKYPQISPIDVKNAIDFLTKKTGIKWTSMGAGLETMLATGYERIKSETCEIAQEKFKVQVSVTNVKPDVTATLRGQEKGYALAQAHIDHPFEVFSVVQFALESTMIKGVDAKTEPLKKVSPIVHSGVSQSVGATVMLLLDGGISLQDAKQMKGIANITMLENGGVVINITDNNYAARLCLSLKNQLTSALYKNINLVTKFGQYKGSVEISDPKDVKKFIEEICGFPAKYTEDFYLANNKLAIYKQISQPSPAPQPVAVAGTNNPATKNAEKAADDKNVQYTVGATTAAGTQAPPLPTPKPNCG